MLKKHWHDMVLHGGRRADNEVWHTSITGKWQKQALARPCLQGRAQSIFSLYSEGKGFFFTTCFRCAKPCCLPPHKLERRVRSRSVYFQVFGACDSENSEGPGALKNAAAGAQRPRRLGRLTNFPVVNRRLLLRSGRAFTSSSSSCKPQ